MDPEQSCMRGKWLVLGVIVLLLGFSAAVSVYYVMVRGTDRLVVQVLRFALEVGLFWMLYCGRPWARWLTVALFGIGGLMGLVRLSVQPGWFGALMSLAFVSAAVLLAASPSIRTFLVGQERRRHCGP